MTFLTRNFIFLLFILPLISYSQIDANSIKTIENIFYGIKLKADYLTAYNSLNENSDCYDVKPISGIIFAKGKKSKTFILGDNYSFPYIALDFDFSNKKLVRRVITLSEEKTKDNLTTIKNLLSVIATKTQPVTEEKSDFLGKKWTEQTISFFNKVGKLFAKIEYTKSVQCTDCMTLKVLVFDSDVH